jgi:hypothetical protein
MLKIDLAVNREDLLEEECIILRNSGEIPEIALQTSLFYLTEDKEGPRITLKEHERQALYAAALKRAREIVLRDLDPQNRDLPFYRGVARSIVNWHRLQNLCSRINRQCPGFEEEVAGALRSFLEKEVEEVQTGCRSSSINCTAHDLKKFCLHLGLDPAELRDGWHMLCLKDC